MRGPGPRRVRRVPRWRTLALWAATALGAAPGAAQIIDRLLAVVDGQVVTQSDLQRRQEAARLLGDEIPADERQALTQVIEDRLIDRQIEQFSGIRVSDEAVNAYLAELNLEARMANAPLREAVRARIARAQYFDARFRQFMRATDLEIRGYYETVFVPEAAARGLDPIPPLAAVEDSIRANIVTEKTQREIAAWTESLYRRSEVEVVE